MSEDGSVVFATMTEGKFFGEISLVFSCPRTASIRSVTANNMWAGCACCIMVFSAELEQTAMYLY